jgi:uncharacterized membrane protein
MNDHSWWGMGGNGWITPVVIVLIIVVIIFAVYYFKDKRKS